jgi:tetratricopeptide (TPR) repeat protein
LSDRERFEGVVTSVVEGRNGRLFIADYGAPDADPLLSEHPFPADRLKRWRRIVETRAGHLARRGVPYVILVAPDAYTASADDLPDGWPRPGGPIGALFRDALADIPNLEVVYPLAELQAAAAEGLQVYKPNDTHWSAIGAFIAHKALLKALPPGLGIRRLSDADVSFGTVEAYGNLGVHADFDRKGAIPLAQVSGEPPERAEQVVGPNRTGFQRFRNPAATARAVVGRDSFATEMGPYLTGAFGEAWLLGPTQSLDYGLIEEVRPDVVILQTSERRLLHVPDDHLALGWRELFRTSMTGPAGKALARMTAAAAARDLDAACELANEVAAADGVAAEHLLHCADVCARAARPGDAALYARRALALDDSFASAWRFVALAELAREAPDEAAWAEAAGRMIAGAPMNALYLTDYGIGLARFGRLDEAIDRWRSIVTDFPEFVAARLQLAAGLNRTGRRDEAQAVCAPVFDLYPEGTRIHHIATRLHEGKRWRDAAAWADAPRRHEVSEEKAL